MSKILNLDKVMPEDRYFVLNGTKYAVPGKLTVSQVLKISKIGQLVQDDPNQAEALIDMVWEILEPINKEKSKNELFDSLAMDELATIVDFIVNGVGGEDEKTEVYDNSKNECGAQTPAA